MTSKRNERKNTFCIYCQDEMGTNAKLVRHLRRKHKGTYAQIALAPMKGDATYEGGK